MYKAWAFGFYEERKKKSSSIGKLERKRTQSRRADMEEELRGRAFVFTVRDNIVS